MTRELYDLRRGTIFSDVSRNSTWRSLLKVGVPSVLFPFIRAYVSFPVKEASK